MNIVTNREDIQKYETLLEEKLKQYVGTKEVKGVTVAVAHGTGETNVWQVQDLGYWFVKRKVDINNKWWNSFGFTLDDKFIEFCEVNVPLEGVNSKIAGAFVEADGKVYLVHKGSNIAGMKKEYVHSHYQGETVAIANNDYRLVVAEITSSNAPVQIGNFLKEIKRLKEAY